MTLSSTESAVRRRLSKHGYQLYKRNGGYMIADAQTNGAVSGAAPVPYSDDLEDVRRFLREDCSEPI